MNPTQKISNSKLDSSNLENYILSINLRIDGLSFLVIDQKQERVHMENYEWLNTINWDISFNKLSTLLLKHEVLSLKFKKVNIYLQSTSSFIIPPDYLIEEKLDLLYQSYLGITNHTIFKSTINSVSEKPIIVFGVENRIADLISKKWNSIEWNHFSNLFISECLVNNIKEEAIFLNFQMNNFEIVATKNGKLESQNYFYFNTADDFAFKLFSFCRQIGFNMDTLKLHIKGKIKEASPLHLLMEKYVANIVFVESKYPTNEQVFEELIQAVNHENS